MIDNQWYNKIKMARWVARGAGGVFFLGPIFQISFFNEGKMS